MKSSSSALTGSQQRAISRRIGPLYVATGLMNFVLWYAVMAPFMVSIGISQTQIALSAIVTNLVIVAVNIPLGMVGDRWSRKGILIGAAVASAMSSLVAASAHGFAIFLISAVLFALNAAAESGSFDAIVYDLVLEETESSNAYPQFLGRLKIVQGVALALSSLAGGVAAQLFEPRITYLLSIPFTLGSIIALLLFREPTVHRRKTDDEPRQPLRVTLREILEVVEIRWVAFTMLAVGVGSTMLMFVDQLWLLALSFALSLYGPANALLLASYAAGGAFVGRLGSSARRLMWVAIITLVCSFGLPFRNAAIVIFAQCTTLAGFTMISIKLGHQLHDVTPSNARSSVSSVVSTLATLLFAPVALFFGFVSDKASVFQAAWIMVVVGVLTLLGTMLVRSTAKT